ncbi:MAG: hypothetical protein WDZ66_03965 [Steroidobacteraceae bacterium]
MTEESHLPQPTVTSNSQAAHLACHTERSRVMRILEMAPEGSVPEPMLRAIAEGTPAAIFATNQRRAAQPTPTAQASAARRTRTTGSKWSAITSRRNAELRARADVGDEEAPGT